MARNVDISTYLPEFMREYAEMKTISDVENEELNHLWVECEKFLNNRFIETMNEDGCAWWERYLNLSVGDTDTLEERRFRIKTYCSQNEVYSYRGVKIVLDNLCGEGNYTLSFVGFDAEVKLELTVKKMYAEVQKMLGEIIPLNMNLNIQLRYNQHNNFNDNTHQYLQAFTHEQMKSGVV